MQTDSPRTVAQIAPTWPRSNMVRDWNTGRTEIRARAIKPPFGIHVRTAWAISRFVERDHRRWLAVAGRP